MSIEFKSTKTFLTCKDHTCSGEDFELLYTPEYDMLLTHPQPSSSELPRYYETKKYISHTDSNKSLTDKIYQFVKAFMLQRKLNLLEKRHPQKGTLLDIGTGTGDFLRAAKRNSWDVFGTEPNLNAQKIAVEKGIHLENDTTKFPAKKFDVITMWHVLEHIPQLETQLSELDRLLKNEGTLFIAVPNFKSYDAKHYSQFWAAYDTPRHLWHFSKSSIVKLFGNFNFKLEETVPLKFDAYYVSMLSEKYKSGRNNFIKAFFTAFISNWKAGTNHEYSSHIYILKREK